MRNLSFLFSATLILSLSGSSFAQGWLEYTNQADYFGVNFPAEPEIEEFTYSSEFNAVFPGRRYAVQVGANSYVATVVDFTDSARIHSEMEKTEAASGPAN